jgi:serine/threonine-protein kinase
VGSGPDETERDEGETASVATVTAVPAKRARTPQGPPTPVPIAPGDRIGRYVVSGELGLGGMGVVLDARDPDLNRRVAIKMLRATTKRSGPVARDRLLREAQALARLSHPNVVAVYDVGSIPAGIYVAMEHVSGPTLRQWLEQAKRTPAEVMRVYAEAGRGLAAAHAADLVHRDFKPANVILGDDGRVRVLDFGLARSAHLAESGGEPVREASPDDTPLPFTERDRLETPLTRYGTVVGTPRYMAPEQYRSAAVGPPADVFAFCVSLYEALYGRHPYGKSTERESRVRTGSLEDTPSIDGVPAHVRRIVLRGLSEDPAARPTIAEILRELARDRWRTWRYAGVAIGLVAVTATAAWWIAPRGGDAPAACADSEALLAGVWDDAARHAVRDRFATAKLSHVIAAGHRAELMLDDYARRWVIKHREVCVATDVEHKQSPQLMDQRMACLEVRRTQLGALAAGLADRRNADAIDNAISAASSLLDLDGCDDPARFGPTVALPVEPAARRAVAQSRAEIVAIEAQVALGSLEAALPAAKAAAARADATGFLPLRAEAADFLAYARLEAGDVDGIEPLLQSMVVLGSQAKNDEIVATGWIEIMRLRGSTQARTADALALRFAAEAALHRAGDPPRLEGDLYQALADIYDIAGDYPASRDAQAHVLELLRKTRGPRHVMVGAALVNLGGTQFGLGEYDSALAYFQEARAIYEEQVGPDSPRVAIALTNIAQVYTVKRRFDEARAMLERALAIKEQALGPTHKGVAITLLGLADVYTHQRRWADALPILERSHAIMAAALPPTHPHVATTASALGGALVHLGKYDEGCALIAPTVELLIKTYGEDGAVVTVLSQADCDVHAGHADAALALLAPAAAAIDKSKAPVDAALVRFRTALAMAAADHARSPRALAQAHEAETLLSAAGADGADDLADVRAWLAAH